MNAILEIGLSNALMALVLAIVAAAAATMRKSHPVLTHTLWLLVFVKLLTPPLIAVPVPVLFERLDNLIVRTDPSEAAEPGRTDGNAAVPSGQSGSWVDSQDDSGAFELDLSTKSVPDPAFVSSHEDALPLVTSGLDESSATSHSHPTAAAGASGIRGVVIAVWLAGSMGWLGLSLVSVWRVCRLLAFARPAPSELREEVRRLARRLRITRCPEVLIVSGRISPMVWPIGRRARILLPANLLERFTGEERSTVLVHELAHLRRRDHWVRLVELVCTVLYWWHPVVWWARSQLRRAEEECCDAWVVTTLPDSTQSYAAALLKTVDLFNQLPKRRPILNPIGSGAATMRFLERRLTMIYREGTPLHLGCRWGVFLVLLAAFVLPIVPGRTTRATASQDATAEPDASETSGAADASAPADASSEGANDDSSQDANEGQAFRLFDSFDGKLELDWDVIRTDPNHVSLDKNPGRLTITSQYGGLFKGVAHNIHMIPNPTIGGGDFVVTTCLEQFHPVEPFQQAGPHIFDDEDNYIKAITARSERSILIGSSWEVRGKFGGRDHIEEDIEWERLWLRIIKRGRAYESSYSLDGKDYTVIAERVWGDGSPQKIGLAVMNENGTSAGLDAAFDFFEVRSLTDEEKNDPLYLERQKLQGIWQVVSSRLGGKAMEKSTWTRFEFHGIEATFFEEGASFTSKYAPHPEKEPKELEFTGVGRELWRNHTRAFGQNRNLMNAVYSIEQDRLVICMDPRQGTPAPTELETKDGDSRLLLELQRVPEVEIAALSRNSRSNQEFVNWLDADHDEQLTIEEFTSDWPTPAAIDRARKVFVLVDQDQDGHVTFDEYRTRSNRATSLLLDRDLDDKLTFDELSSGPLGKILPNRRRRIFQLLDKNDDGTLTHEEHAARSAEYWFVKLDVNDDNRMSLREYSAGNQPLVRNGRIQRVFSALDRDGDANVSLEEFSKKPQEALFGKSDANADKELSFKEFAVWRRGPEEIAAAEKDFARKDADGNGALSFKEYAFRGEDDEFWKADQNGDNRLNRDEFESSQIWVTAGDSPAAFRLLDQNRDDNICLSEFRNRLDSDRPNAAKDP